MKLEEILTPSELEQYERSRDSVFPTEELLIELDTREQYDFYLESRDMHVRDL